MAAWPGDAGCGRPQPCRGSNTEFAFDCNYSTVRRGDLVGNCKPKANAAEAAGGASLNLHKGFEDALQVLFADAIPPSRTTKGRHPSASHSKPMLTSKAGRGKLYRVGDQVHQDYCFDAGDVSLDFHSLDNVGDDRDVGLLRQIPAALYREPRPVRPRRPPVGRVAGKAFRPIQTSQKSCATSSSGSRCCGDQLIDRPVRGDRPDAGRAGHGSGMTHDTRRSMRSRPTSPSSVAGRRLCGCARGPEAGAA